MLALCWSSVIVICLLCQVSRLSTALSGRGLNLMVVVSVNLWYRLFPQSIVRTPHRALEAEDVRTLNFMGIHICIWANKLTYGLRVQRSPSVVDTLETW